MAEWLGEGLQNLLRRFDSVWYLNKVLILNELALFYWLFVNFFELLSTF